MIFVPLTINGNTAVLHLTKGKHSLLDVADWHLVSPYKWIIWGQYATRAKRKDEPGENRRVLLHRLLAGDPDGLVVDHVNRNKLDNRRANLRSCTNQQNQFNRDAWGRSSGYLGVTTDRGKWKAHIEIAGKTTNLGRYDTPEEAARVRDASARQLHGEFAVLNFPDDHVEVYVPSQLRRMEKLLERIDCPHCGKSFSRAGMGQHARACAAIFSETPIS